VRPLREASLSLWQGLKWYHEVCGNRGICAIASFRLFGKPREIAVVPRRSSYPVFLRIDTSDFCAYRDVLAFQTKSYDPGMSNFTPKVIVDAGAHIGMASIFFALKYPAARIFAIEPEAANFAALLRNTAPYKQITPIRAALWREDGEVALGPSDAHPKGAHRIAADGTQRVRAITMDTLIREIGVSSIDLLKVDIEGAEIEVFRSCPWISDVRLLAIELHDRVRDGCSSVVYQATKSLECSRQGEITFFAQSTIKRAGQPLTHISESRSPLS
jgi:FkbM family methyltransferase